MRVEIESRRGNVVIGVVGVLYAVSGVVLLAAHFIQTLGAASLLDRAIQLALLIVIAVSVWFMTIAARGLQIRLRRLSLHHRTGAAAAR